MHFPLPFQLTGEVVDTGFIDLDVLLIRVRNPQSKVHFLDAIKAYKAGALRGALTSAWVAVVYDLIAKYRELSALGDVSAAAFLKSWDNATTSGDITKLLQLERNIIEDATTSTQVVNHIARTQLERLREDRHLCAHPAFSAEADLFEPSPELVRLHLVNAVDLVLSQEPLQGKAIFDLFDVDVQSLGFPTGYERILDYVEHRYLARVRVQNVRNFGTVLAKSLIRGVPPQWEALHDQIVSSLVAVRDRASHAWAGVSASIVRILDNIDPADRPRAISFIAAFPDFWPMLQSPTHTVLQATIENARDVAEIDYRLLEGAAIPQLSAAVSDLIAGLNRQQLAEAIAHKPLEALWRQAITKYKESPSWRGSEDNFKELILPFAARLSSRQTTEILGAVVENGQNWDAAGTPGLLLALLRNTTIESLPDTATRNDFYRTMRHFRRLNAYQEVITLLQGDGWVSPPPAEEQEA